MSESRNFVAESLQSSAIQMLRGLRTADNATGLTPQRLSALSVVVFRGPLSLQRLADAEQVKPPTMIRIVQALEEQGLLTRELDQADARAVVIQATRRGKRVLLQGRGRRLAILNSAMRQLSAAEQGALRNAAPALAKLAAAVAT